LDSTGFADGALARWRTLHELTVVCWFLVEHGETVAERYLLHLDIDSLRAAEQYSEFAPLLGYRPISRRRLDRLKRRRTQLAKRFGKDFSNEYGWASGALRNPKPNFSDIEKAVKLSRMRPYYKLASGNVHAGPKGAFFRIGMLATGPQVLLAGPSNAGLDEAGRLAAISLAQITVALLHIKPTLDSVISAKILVEVSNDAEAEFIKVQRALKREDLARQKEQAKKKPVGKTKKG
jgi:hypothetical protein